jgi:hypothetical protein
MTSIVVSRFRHLLTAAGFSLLILASSPACAASSGTLYVRVGPPPPVYERAIVSPGPGYAWVPGYYRWDGRAYVWAPGVWTRPPHARSHWVAGHWAQSRHGWYYVNGRWH